MLDHNSAIDQYGNFLGGGFVGKWIEYHALVEDWLHLTMDQEAGVIDVKLIKTKALLIEAAEELLEEWELVEKDLKNVRKATRALPPK